MDSLEELRGESAPVAAVREQAARLLASGAGARRRLPPVLILGETGTGKGLLAGSLHRAGARRAGPFVDVNCAAIPDTLLEAELFGFERGAFTDARQAKPGLFQVANGGTIFLDEVGLLPLPLQSKLLKVLEERSLRRLGSTRSEPLDVWAIAATSEDLAAAVDARRFRADLYHRLAVVTLQLPPLRTRGRDIVLLAEHFLEQVSHDYGLPPRTLTPDAQAALLAYPWPGNVRELANAIERAALLSDAPELTAARLGLPAPAAGRAAMPGAAAASTGEGAPAAASADPEAEARLLLDVLRAVDWNFTRAAARLGLPRNTLRYRVERLGLAPEGPPERRRGGRPVATTRAATPPGSPPPGELPRQTRRVTLLQARLTAAAPDAGDWETSRLLEESAAKVRSFGGRVEELTARELLAAFGLDTHEEAPRRAAHAAGALRALAARARRELRPAAAETPTAFPGPELTVALHTQSLLLTGEGTETRIDPGARQEAQRALRDLLEVAAPGRVVASASAARFLARRFGLTPLPAAAGGPPGACQVAAGGGGAGPGRTGFVGRERELRLLTECFELAQAGHGQLAMIVGEPGIGKSRLLHELCRRLGASVTWVEGHALSFGRSMPLHPVVDMLRRVFRIDDADPGAIAIDKIERAVQRLGPGADEARPFLRYLLSVDPGDPAVLAMDPKRRLAAMVRATHLLLELGAALRPHVLVLEDLHWADPATEEWVARLADGIATKRVLVLLTYRPGYRPPFGGRSFHTALALSTLSGEDSLRIAGGLLGSQELPPALRALVVAKAEGNPFFVEELVRSLEELGAVERAGGSVAISARLDQVAVPDTIEEVILARIHRLDGPLRELLEVAAVIGKTVAFPLLRAVTGRPEEALGADLQRLQAAEFLHEARVFPELEHTFKHALTQDVAYGSVERGARRVLHARIAQAIEQLYLDRPGEHVERLAYHALRGEQWPQALRYLRQAGAKAFDRSANREAVASLEQALGALTHLPESREVVAEAVDIRLALRSALLQLGEIRRIPVYLREAESLAATLGDRPRLAWVWTYMTIAHLFEGDPGQAMAAGSRALALAEEAGDPGLRATARTPLAHACRERGDHRRAVALFTETIRALPGDLARERLGQAMPPALYARNMASMSLAELGEFAEARRLGEESAGLAQALDLPFGLVLARVALGHTALVQGRPDQALPELDAALDLIEARGLPTWFAWAAALRGYALALGGEPAAGIALMEQAIARATALPLLFGHSQWVAWLAHALRLDGRMDDAHRLGAEALALSRQRGERGYEAWALLALGDIETGRGAIGPAGTYLGQALALATDLGMRPLAARCHLALSRLQGAGDANGDHLATARQLLAQLDMGSGAGRADPLSPPALAP